MKFFFVLSSIYLISLKVSYGQKAETIERLNAARIPKTNIIEINYNELDGSKKYFYYTPDPPVAVPQPVPKYFSVSGKVATFHVISTYINPMDIAFSLSSKESDNPNIKIESDFFANFVNPAIPANALSGVSARSGGGGTPTSELIPEWLLELKRTQTSNALFNNYDLTMATEFSNLEKYLTGNFTLSSGVSNSFEKHIYAAVSALKSSADGPTFNRNLTDAITVLNELNKITQNTINIQLNNVIAKMKTPPFGGYDNSVVNFSSYTSSSVDKLTRITNQIVKEKNTLKNSYSKLLDRLKKVKIVNNDIYLTVSPLTFEPNKDLTITIKVTKLSLDEETLDITEKDSKETQFSVIERGAQLEVSGGIAYFFNPVIFNSYNLYSDNGAYKIGNTESKKFIIPTMYLNYYRRISNRMALILPQFGVGTGKEYPTFLIGTGIAIPSRLILSTGLALAFNQTLKDEYTLNSVVDITKVKAITDAYFVKIEPRLYLSLQFKF